MAWLLLFLYISAKVKKKDIMKRLVKQIEDITVTITFAEADEYDTSRQVLCSNDEIMVLKNTDPIILHTVGHI